MTGGNDGTGGGVIGGGGKGGDVTGGGSGGSGSCSFALIRAPVFSFVLMGILVLTMFVCAVVRGLLVVVVTVGSGRAGAARPR